MFTLLVLIVLNTLPLLKIILKNDFGEVARKMLLNITFVNVRDDI